ncbi:MAG: TraB/GumN family protein [Rhodanobacter sp.]
MSLFHHLRRCAAIALLSLLPVTTALAQPALWMVKNAHTTIYLFGTVHLLPDDTTWHYPALDQALAASDSLTIELTDDDSASMQALVLQYGLDPAHPLSARLTPAENASLAQAAQTAGLPGGIQTLQIMRPWLAALTLAVAPLVKAGLDPAHGVDKLLKAQMQQAGKPVNGMETAEQQIRFLADLPPDVELAFLRSTLHDIDKGPAELTELISAWKNGDIATIARIEDEDVRQQAPELYQRLLVQRNQAWASKIATMLQQSGTVFIAVGAGHLAGPDSVQVQLGKLGIEAIRQ